MKKRIFAIIALLCLMLTMAGCSMSSEVSGTMQNTADTKAIANKLTTTQPTPTDIDYSLERYNLIRRTYWVNGQREKANMLICEVEKPLGYIALFSGNTVVSKFVVDGKVTSLNSFLSPDSEYFELSTGSSYTHYNNWLSDVDGSYGENDSGIFFFTPDGNYIEWTGDYLYSDIPFEISNPVVTYEVAK